MAIAPSKLGHFVAGPFFNSDDNTLIRDLRAAGLVRAGVSDQELLAVFSRARDEDEAIPKGGRRFNSPHERVRVFLEPYLTEKGRTWAVPVDSLDLPD